MADRDVEFNLSATDRTHSATDSAADGFEHLGREADKAQRKIDDLGDETGQLARKMLEAKGAALALAREFDKTGDSKILKDFEKINREAAKLARVSKSLKFDAPEVKNPSGFLGTITKLAREAGIISSKAIIEGAGDLWKALPEKLKTGIIAAGTAAAVVLAPELASAIGGAVLAGVGAGAIGGTILIAAQNEKVAQQYGILGNVIQGKLRDAAKPMTEQLLAAVPRLGKAFDAELPIIQRIMGRAASDFQPILEGALKAVHVIMPAIERAAAVGGKVLGNIAGQLPQLAGAVGNLLDAFSSGGEEGAYGLSLLITQLSVLLNLIALMAKGSSAGLRWLGQLAELLGLVNNQSSSLGTLASAQDRAALSASQAGMSYEQLSDSLGNTANMAKQLQDNFNQLFGTMMNVDQANLAVNVGMANLTKTIRDNKKTLDQSTESGQQNTAVVLDQIQKLDQKRQADIAAGNGTAQATAQANAAYASQVQSLRNLLVAMGLPIGAVDALISKYAQIPTNITTTITTVYRTKGTPPGYSDELTGHSRTGGADLSGLDGWGPARFNAGRGRDYAMNGSATTQPPVQVHSDTSVNVLLDGQPFRAQIRASTTASEQRQAWRNHVGTR